MSKKLAKKFPLFDGNATPYVFLYLPNRHKIFQMVSASFRSQFELEIELKNAGFIPEKDFLVYPDGFSYKPKVKDFLDSSPAFARFLQSAEAIRKIYNPRNEQ